MIFINTKMLFAVAAFATSFQGVKATDCIAIGNDQTTCETAPFGECTFDGSTCQYTLCENAVDTGLCLVWPQCQVVGATCQPDCSLHTDQATCEIQTDFSIGSNVVCEWVPAKNPDGSQGASECLFIGSYFSGSETVCNDNTQTRWCTGTLVADGVTTITTCNNPDKYYPPNNLYTWSCADAATGVKRNLRANNEYTEGSLLLDTAGKV